MLQKHFMQKSQRLVKVRTTRILAQHRRRKTHITKSASAKEIGIIGAGAVGSAITSSLIHRNLVKNIYINDLNTDLCQGVVYDLEDEAFITGTNIFHTKHPSELRNCDIIIINAGAKQRPNEPRTELIDRNAIVMKSILRSILPLKPGVILLFVSNPVDVLTSVVQEWCHAFIPRAHIIGSGTYLDTQRLRVAISKKLNISVKSVHGYILGEHGDSQVFPKSITRIGGSLLTAFPEMTQDEINTIEYNVRSKAYEIIKRKGATSHGIGECVATICESIILDKNEVMCVSSFHPIYKTCIGWPSVIGSNGIVQTLQLDLVDEDRKKIEASAKVIEGISKDVTSRISLFD